MEWMSQVEEAGRALKARVNFGLVLGPLGSLQFLKN